MMKLAMPGPRQMSILKNFIPSMVVFGATGVSYLLFFTSAWKGKDLLQYIPVYNAKYEVKDPDM